MTESRAPYNNLPWGITINGNPIPKGRPRVYKGHATTPKRTRAYEKLVRQAAGITWRGEPTKQPLSVTLHFWRGDERRCDIDNLIKAILDALNGIVWEDDVQVRAVHAYRDYDNDRPRVEISVGPA